MYRQKHWWQILRQEWRRFYDMVVPTDQAQFWAHGSFYTPLIFAKQFCRLNIVLVVLNPFFKCFRDKFSTFDHLDKDTKSYVSFSPVKDDKQILKPLEMQPRSQALPSWERGCEKCGKRERTIYLNVDLQRVRDEFSYLILFRRRCLIWHEIDLKIIILWTLEKGVEIFFRT
jgi:hypothetical protein